MRALTSSEKRLSLFLGVALFLIANVFLLNAWLQGTKAMRQQRTDLSNLLIEQEIWLEDEAYWTERRQWLDANQPMAAADGSAGTSLLEFVRTSASQHGVQILQQSLAEPNINPDYHEHSVQLRVSANLEGLARWLAEIQKPESFHAITAFNLKSDKEPPTVLCDLQIARWYRP